MNWAAVICSGASRQGKLLVNKRLSSRKLGEESPLICQKKIPACWRNLSCSGQRNIGSYFHLFSVGFFAEDFVQAK